MSVISDILPARALLSQLVSSAQRAANCTALAMDIRELEYLLHYTELMIRELEKRRSQKISVDDYQWFNQAVDQVYQTCEVPTPGVDGVVVANFRRSRGIIPRAQALRFAENLRSFLVEKLAELSEVREGPVSRANPWGSTWGSPAERRTSTFILAEEWTPVQLTFETKVLIAKISELLDRIILRLERSNSPPEEQGLTELERQQLTTILKRPCKSSRPQ